MAKGEFRAIAFSGTSSIRSGAVNGGQDARYQRQPLRHANEKSIRCESSHFSESKKVNLSPTPIRRGPGEPADLDHNSAPASVIRRSGRILRRACFSAARIVSERKSIMEMLKVPDSLHWEHHDLHHGLAEAAADSGATGEAARRASDLIHSHIEKEGEFLTPLLGLLPSLARRGSYLAGRSAAFAQQPVVRPRGGLGVADSGRTLLFQRHQPACLQIVSTAGARQAVEYGFAGTRRRLPRRRGWSSRLLRGGMRVRSA